MSEILQNQNIFFDGYKITSSLNSVALNVGVEMQDDTAFGDATKSNKPGLKTVAAQVDGYYDAGPIDQALNNNFGVSNKVLTFAENSTAGSLARFFKMALGDYAPIKGGKVGDIAGFSAGGQSTKSDLIRGQILENLTGQSTTGNGAARNIGAVSSTQKLYAALHVFAVNNPADTLIVTLQSDPTGAFSGSQTTRITFASMSAVGSQFMILSGPITDAYYRGVHTITGTTPSFDYALVIGIL